MVRARKPVGSQVIRLEAPAKLTTRLRVTGVRADGMHEIDAEMVSLDWGDSIDVVVGSTGIDIVGEAASGLQVAAGDNLIAKALELANAEAAVTVTKRIPAGAGLGGGSSDAAAILRWAGFADVARAADIGADVAYCLVGGRANVSGIGEVVEPLQYEERLFTLLTPPLHCSTPLVYRTWDEMGGPTGSYGNDLEPAAVAMIPELAGWRDRLGDATGETPRLAGSGSTWFVEGAYPDAGRVTRTIPAEHSTSRTKMLQ